MGNVFSGESAGQESWTIITTGISIALIIFLLSIYIKFVDVTQYTGPAVVATSLLPMLVTAAGPIIDIVNQQFQYSIATIVGILGILLVSVVGSKNADGVFAYIFRTEDTGSWTTKYGVNWASVIAVAVGSAAGMGTGFGIKNKTISGIFTSIAIIGVFGLLSARGYLRSDSVAEIPVTSMFGRISSYVTGKPIVAAAAPVKGGAILEVVGEKCILPGYDGLESQIAPSNVILPLTILMCHLIEYWDNRRASESMSAGVTAGIILGLQAVVFYTNGCSKYYRFGGWSFIIAILLAGVFSSTAYSVMKYEFPKENFGGEGGIFHPYVVPQPKTKTAGKSDIKIKTSGAAVTASADLFDQAENEDYEEVVGVLFKDGEPISDVSILKN